MKPKWRKRKQGFKAIYVKIMNFVKPNICINSKFQTFGKTVFLFPTDCQQPNKNPKRKKKKVKDGCKRDFINTNKNHENFHFL